MSSMIDDIKHLSREIGARPAGTEEEHLAAMYIAENIQKRSGLPFDIEEFEGVKGQYNVINILSLISAILVFLAVILQFTTIPALILTVVIAFVCLLEYTGKPVISGFFRYGISQNVVAKYVPAYSSENSGIQRKRKVVFVSHYDSGRSFPENSNTLLSLISLSRIAALIGDYLIVLFLLIKMFAFAETTGAATLVCIIIAFLFLVVCSSPLLIDLYKNRLLYNEGANCNASGNAALIEIAKQLGTGSYSTDEDFDNKKAPAKIHGYSAAKSAGVIPDNANINYKNMEMQNKNKEDEDPLAKKESDLAQAKAAVAAFMSPRKPRAKYDDEGNVINDGLQTNDNNSSLPAVTIDDASAQRNDTSASATSSIPSYATENKSNSDVPDWFKSAQQKAKKDVSVKEVDTNSQQRSRFAHTMDVMAQRQIDEENKKKAEEEKKRAALRAQIEAANKAAEEERKKKFANKKHFYNNDENTNQDDGAAPAKIDNTNKITLDNADAKEQSVQAANNSFVEKANLDIKNADNQIISEAQKENSINTQFKNEEIKEQNDVSLPQNTFAQMPDADDKTTKISASDIPTIVSNIENSPINKPSDENVFASAEVSNTASAHNNNAQKLNPENSGQIRLDDMKQYAPLDDQSFISSNEMPQNDSLVELPEVFTGEKNIEENPEYAKALEQNGPAQNNDDNTFAQDNVEKGKFGTGSFAAISQNDGVAGATATFAPVKEELVVDASKSGEITRKEDMVIADADDSVYSEGEFTNTGAFAGKGYVDMPDEKRKGLFGIFSRKDKNQGKHINDGGVAGSEQFIKDNDNIIDNNAWDGGAFRSLSDRINLQKIIEREGTSDAAAEEEFVDDYPQDQNAEEKFFDAPITSEKNRINSMVDPIPDFEQQIQEFHESSINMEVWMVALGAELDENAGMKSFLLEHAQELRGAIIIDVEGLGAGDLNLVSSEGFIKKAQTSSRMKRYIRSAANKLGTAVPSIEMPWSNSSAAYANKCGFKTLRLVGVEHNKPAYYMSKNDVIENIDENILNKNVKYLLQLIQTI